MRYLNNDGHGPLDRTWGIWVTHGLLYMQWDRHRVVFFQDRKTLRSVFAR